MSDSNESSLREMSTLSSCVVYLPPSVIRKYSRRRELLFARADARISSKKNIRRLFHDEIIPDGLDPIDAACDLASLIDCLLRINEAAQLSDSLAGLYADLK